MESHQLAQGLDDLLPYQERSLLRAAPYTLKNIKTKGSKVPMLGVLGHLPTFWHVGQSRRVNATGFGGAGLGCKSVGAQNSMVLL